MSPNVDTLAEPTSRLTLPAPISAIQRFQRDTWRFMAECMYTLDQTDKINPIKRYPSDKEYLECIVRAMIEEYLLAIVKHRRMIITWTACGVILADAMFNEGRFNVLVSKKEEDSDELVRRCRFVYDNIPPSILPIKPKMIYKYTELKFPEIDSVIKGVPAGKDQLRQYTCSRIVADEFGFWPNARETFVAMRPTLQGGGKITLISTRFPGFFKEIIEDSIEEE